jgi:hypothetical protein
MYKVFIPAQFGENHSLFIELNSKFNIVSNPEEADLIFLTGNRPDLNELKNIVKPHHILIILEIYHIDNFMSLDWYRQDLKSYFSILTKKIIIVHTDLNIKDNCNLIYFDHMFDRQKLYCTEYVNGINLRGRVWTYSCNENIYKLHPINKVSFKKFLAPMRIYSPSEILSETPLEQQIDFLKFPRMSYRLRIKKHLSKNNDSFISPNDPNASFLPNAVNNLVLKNVCSDGFWFPISYVYYDNSLINVYTETLVSNRNNVRMITEKTFDPLIQGNFILPFGYSGLIKDILSYGFKLPNWIDYSYDSILDNEERFSAYLESLNKLSDCSLEQLYNQTITDMKIIEHNRSVFYTRPYSYTLLPDKIKTCIEYNEQHGWKD